MAVVTSLILLLLAFEIWRAGEVERLESNSEVIDTRAGPMEVAIRGEGPTVLVLHGTLGGYDQLLPVAEHFDTDSYRFIFVSRPGYLRTPLSTGASFEDQANAYADLIDELGIHQVALIAVSGAGPSALEFALHHADRVWGLVLIAANSDVRADTGHVPSPETSTHASEVTTRVLLSDFTSWVATGVAKLAPRRFLFALVGDENVELVLADPDRSALYAGMRESLALLSRRRDGALNDGQQFLTYGDSPFHEISVPTLILHGTHDTAVNPKGALRLHRLIEDSTYIEIEGGTHYMVISHIDIIAPAIMSFLDAHVPD